PRESRDRRSLRAALVLNKADRSCAADRPRVRMATRLDQVDPFSSNFFKGGTMTGRLKLAAFALLAILLASAPASAGGNANFIVGGRTLIDNGFWNPLDSQYVYGANVDFGKKEWPVNLEGGLFFSRDNDNLFGADVTAKVREISFGVNKTWSPHKNL